MLNNTNRCYLCNGTIFWGEKVAVMIDEIETGDKGTVNCLELGNEIIDSWNKDIRKHNMRKAHQGCYDEMIEIIHKHYIRS